MKFSLQLQFGSQMRSEQIVNPSHVASPRVTAVRSFQILGSGSRLDAHLALLAVGFRWCFILFSIVATVYVRSTILSQGIQSATLVLVVLVWCLSTSPYTRSLTSCYPTPSSREQFEALKQHIVCSASFRPLLPGDATQHLLLNWVISAHISLPSHLSGSSAPWLRLRRFLRLNDFTGLVFSCACNP